MTELTPFKLTPLGLFHTLVSIACVVLAFVALHRNKGISPGTPVGRAYLVTLWITTLSGFPIFRHGKAGPPHVVGVITVLVLLVAAVAGKTRVGRLSAHVETVSYSLTILLLMIPTVTETLTRVPPGAAWVASPEAAIFPPLYAVLVVLFLVGVTWQVRKLVPRASDGRIVGA